MFDFTPFFGQNKKAFSGRQMRGLAGMINLAIEAPGPLENVVSTCFLEGTHGDRALRSAMGKARRGKTG